MIYQWDLNPVAFSLFGWPVHWYGLAYFISFFVVLYGSFWVLKFSEKNHPSFSDWEYLLFGTFFCGILGGRLGEIIFYRPELFLSDPLEIIKIWHGGMSIHGGLIVAIIFAVYWTRKKKFSFWLLVDAVAIFLPIGLMLGRIANFWNGELWGRITDQTWGVIFPHVDEMLRHPSQLYEAGKNLLLFLILFFLWRWVQPRPGVIFAVFLGGYGILRFIVEFFREPEIIIWYLTMGQWLSVLVLLVGAIIWQWQNSAEKT